MSMYNHADGAVQFSGDEGVQRARPKVYNHGDIFTKSYKFKINS